MDLGTRLAYFYSSEFQIAGGVYVNCSKQSIINQHCMVFALLCVYTQLAILMHMY